MRNTCVCSLSITEAQACGRYRLQPGRPGKFGQRTPSYVGTRALCMVIDKMRLDVCFWPGRRHSVCHSGSCEIGAARCVPVNHTLVGVNHGPLVQ
jgi:hypothetical protein